MPRLDGTMTGPEAPNPGQASADRSTEAAPSTAEPAALRDAESIAARVTADEAAAAAEQDRLLHEPLPLLDAPIDRVIQLLPGEQLHAERHAALLERRQGGTPSGGTLYLTSERLLHIGSERIDEIPLERIADMAVAMERLLLIELTDGSDLAIEVDQPRLLRVQVAAARGAIRERRA